MTFIIYNRILHIASFASGYLSHPFFFILFKNPKISLHMMSHGSVGLGALSILYPHKFIYQQQKYTICKAFYPFFYFKNIYAFFLILNF